MSTILSDPTTQIARRLTLEREARSWSQADLAARAGVSRAMISKIERGQASPTATILGRLSGALELTMATLLARAEAGSARLVKAGDQPIWVDPETAYVRRQVFAKPGGALEIVQVSLPAGAQVAYPAASYAFLRHHLVWLLSGSLVIEENEVGQHLEAGDCLEFGEPAPIVYRNPGPAEARYVVALCKR